VLVIEPGMAFGTGQHATTRTCLEEIDALAGTNAVESALDVGTGSGVLAAALARLGVARVVAIDSDLAVLPLARANLDRNGARDVVLLAGTVAAVRARFDLVVANILADTLVAESCALALAVAEGGCLVLSGILADRCRTCSMHFPAGARRTCAPRTRGERFGSCARSASACCVSSPRARRRRRTVRIPRSELRHLRTLRLVAGDRLCVFDEAGREHEVLLERVTAREASGRIVATSLASQESPLELILVPALLKHDKMDWVIEKATELGVSRIAPIVTRFTIARGEPLERWRRIALSAAEAMRTDPHSRHRPPSPDRDGPCRWLAGPPAACLGRRGVGSPRRSPRPRCRRHDADRSRGGLRPSRGGGGPGRGLRDDPPRPPRPARGNGGRRRDRALPAPMGRRVDTHCRRRTARSRHRSDHEVVAIDDPAGDVHRADACASVRPTSAATTLRDGHGIRVDPSPRWTIASSTSG
jgi:SAM-dependent methyltransferase